MISRSRGRLLLGGLLFTLCVAARAFGATPVSCSGPAKIAPNAVEYFISGTDYQRHLLHIAIRYQSSGATVFQMPVWNALYQVRDFAQYVTGVRARDSKDQPLPVTAVDKTSWKVASTQGCAVVDYTVYANTPGPFSSQVNADHVFLNWAEVLLYQPARREAPLALAVNHLPSQWHLHDLGRFNEMPFENSYQLREPVAYDVLVDSPVDIGPSEITTFEQDGAIYRIVVDADTKDYKLPELQDAVKKVVHAEVDWMQDRPFNQYTFLYHFPHGPIGGGMEHSFGTAITTPAIRLKDNPLAPIDTTAHEFFHLWNVKRIRPQSMEPVDFEHEQYSRALWFCEGVTSAASEILLVRAGLVNERGYLSHLSEVLTEFESRPAHRSQSPEDSSVEAWLEGKPFYRRPERSVSYYTSGDLLGVLLDLRIRAATHGKKSLRDLFQYLNVEYARKGLFYDDSKDIQRAAETVSGASFEEFFAKYVRGTEPIPYDDFLAWVGLKVEPFTILGTEAGFDATVNFTGLPEVVAITPGSEVEAAGVHVGDVLTAINGEEYQGDVGTFLAGRKPGEKVTFRFSSHGRPLSVNVELKPHNEQGYGVVDLPTVSANQRAQRTAWITGDDLASTEAR